MPEGRTRMDADRQAMALGGSEHWPPLPATERRLLHGEHLHLHETLVLGAALDLIDREFDVLRRHRDRGAQARIVVEPFLGDPVVDCARDRPRHVLAEDQFRAVEAIEDRRAHPPSVEYFVVTAVTSVAARPFLPLKSSRAVSGAFGG